MTKNWDKERNYLAISTVIKFVPLMSLEVA